jgi:YD repeat-containing protein
LEIKRTNSYAYTNGLVLTHTDERGLTTTNYWDDLQRLTRVDYPNGSISNIYTQSPGVRSQHLFLKGFFSEFDVVRELHQWTFGCS